MNDNMSIFLATTILALGGLGLYMFKSSHDHQGGDDHQGEYDSEEYNEDSMFDPTNSIGSLFNWGTKNDAEDEDKLENSDDEDYKPRKKAGKTQKNRKSTSNSRRRY